MSLFEDIRLQLADSGEKRRVGVVCAQEIHTLEAVIRAADDHLIDPVLIGDRQAIRQVFGEIGADGSGYEMHQAEDPVSCARLAARMVKAGELDCLMKGKIETGILMKEMVNRDNGIRYRDTMSQVTFLESPYYHKLLAVTDAGLLIRPNAEQKADVIRNAVDAMKALGVNVPKVAVLAAVEHPNPKMPETLDAERIMQMQGDIEGCVIEGPISYDLAIDQKAAQIKEYKSPVAGDADILVVPDLVCGNVLAKSLVYTGGARMAGAVIGAVVPLILTSRSSSADDKYMSIVINALIGRMK